MIDTKIFKPRNMRRGVLLALLLAPIVYLFGTQFFALAGAHGEEVLDKQSYFTPDYDELMHAENFNYGSFDWSNEHGTRLGFSLGHLYTPDYYFESEVTFYANEYGVEVYSEKNGYVLDNFGLGFSGFDTSHYFGVTINTRTEPEFVDVNLPDDKQFYFCFYLEPSNDDTDCTAVICKFSSFDGFEFLVYGSSGGNWIAYPEVDWDGWADTRFCFDDGAQLPQGIEWNDELRSYFVPSVKPVESPNYSDTLFGSMFNKDNFLSDLGEDVIAGEQVGFKPLGDLIKFVDDNALHLHGYSWGDLVIGYGYYVVNVVLLWEFVCISLMVLLIPFKCLDWFDSKIGGNRYD